MKATIISHTYVTPMNQAKVQAMAEYFSEVQLIVPRQVRDTLRTMVFEPLPLAQFKYATIDAHFDFHNSTRLYQPFQLSKALQQGGSDVWIIEQEPYSLSTLQVIRLKKKFGVKVLLYSFQNIYKKYPVPFSAVERYCLSLADGLIVGSESAQEVWRKKGYPADKIHILPQVGVDLDFFTPRWNRATDRQQIFMQVIATLPNSNDEFSVQDITTASRDLLVKAFNPSHATQMLGHLAEKGLIYRNRRGAYCFAVPLLADFIQRQSWDAATRRLPAS